MFIGTSMAVLCIAVAIAIGIVWLTSKGKIKGKGYIIFILNQIWIPFWIWAYMLTKRVA